MPPWSGSNLGGDRVRVDSASGRQRRATVSVDAPTSTCIAFKCLEIHIWVCCRIESGHLALLSRLLRRWKRGMVSPAHMAPLAISNSLSKHIKQSVMSSHQPQLPGTTFQSGRATLLGPGRGIGRPSAASGSIDIPHLNVFESPVFLPIGPVRLGPASASQQPHEVLSAHDDVMTIKSCMYVQSRAHGS